MLFPKTESLAKGRVKRLELGPSWIQAADVAGNQKAWLVIYTFGEDSSWNQFSAVWMMQCLLDITIDLV